MLIVTLVGFIAASIFAAGSATFAALLGARLLQGLMSASTRVLAVAIVRDGASGRQMARTLSIAQMIFFLVPILAPTLGQGLLAFGPWRFIFYALGGVRRVRAGLGAVAPARDAAGGAAACRSRSPSCGKAIALTLTNRYSVGYAVAASLTFGGIIAFVSSAQQIFVDEFGAGERFTLLFALCAFAMGVRLLRQQPAGRAAGDAADLAGGGAGADRAVGRPSGRHRRRGRRRWSAICSSRR